MGACGHRGENKGCMRKETLGRYYARKMEHVKDNTCKERGSSKY